MENFEIEFHTAAVTEEQADSIYRHHDAPVSWHDSRSAIIITARGANAYIAERHIRAKLATYGVTSLDTVRRTPLSRRENPPQQEAEGLAAETFEKARDILDSPGVIAVLSIPSKGTVIKISGEELADWMDESSVDAWEIGASHTALRFANQILTALNLTDNAN